MSRVKFKSSPGALAQSPVACARLPAFGSRRTRPLQLEGLALDDVNWCTIAPGGKVWVGCTYFPLQPIWPYIMIIQLGFQFMSFGGDFS